MLQAAVYKARMLIMMCPQSLDIEILTSGEHRKQDFGSPQAVNRVDGLVKETPEDSPASQAPWGHSKMSVVCDLEEAPYGNPTRLTH